MDLPGLIQWIGDERVKADQWIFSEHDNRWQKAADLPELQPALHSKPPAGVTGAATAGKSSRSLGLKSEALGRKKVFSGLDSRTGSDRNICCSSNYVALFNTRVDRANARCSACAPSPPHSLRSLEEIEILCLTI